LAYGKKYGAVRAFLLADECNLPFIYTGSWALLQIRTNARSI
jgi:hypothetical protein